MKKNSWLIHVEKFRKKNPKLTYKECLQKAVKTYKLKNQKGGEETIHFDNNYYYIYNDIIKTPCKLSFSKNRKHIFILTIDSEHNDIYLLYDTTTTTINNNLKIYKIIQIVNFSLDDKNNSKIKLRYLPVNTEKNNFNFSKNFKVKGTYCDSLKKIQEYFVFNFKDKSNKNNFMKNIKTLVELKNIKNKMNRLKNLDLKLRFTHNTPFENFQKIIDSKTLKNLRKGIFFRYGIDSHYGDIILVMKKNFLQTITQEGYNYSLQSFYIDGKNPRIFEPTKVKNIEDFTTLQEIKFIKRNCKNSESKMRIKKKNNSYNNIYSSSYPFLVVYKNISLDNIDYILYPSVKNDFFISLKKNNVKDIKFIPYNVNDNYFVKTQSFGEYFRNRKENIREQENNLCTYNPDFRSSKMFLKKEAFSAAENKYKNILNKNRTI